MARMRVITSVSVVQKIIASIFLEDSKWLSQLASLGKISHHTEEARNLRQLPFKIELRTEMFSPIHEDLNSANNQVSLEVDSPHFELQMEPQPWTAL